MGLARSIIPKYKKASTSRLPPAKLPIFRSVVSHPPPPYLTGEKVSRFSPAHFNCQCRLECGTSAGKNDIRSLAFFFMKFCAIDLILWQGEVGLQYYKPAEEWIYLSSLF